MNRLVILLVSIVTSVFGLIGDPFLMDAGGRYLAKGTFSSKLIYPPVDTVTSATSSFYFDPDNERYAWYITPTNLQLTLPNVTYFVNNGTCTYSNQTYADEWLKWQAAVQVRDTLSYDEYSGLIRDVAAGPMYLSVWIRVSNTNRMTNLGFGQVLTQNDIPVHIAGVINFNYYSLNFNNAIFNVPVACLGEIEEYDSIYYPDDSCVNGSLQTPL